LVTLEGLQGQFNARFGKKYFVRWDGKDGGKKGYKGGRWFETDIDFQRDGLYSITTHDGDKGNYTADEISKLGETSKKGDNVLCYRTRSNNNFAFKGVHKKTEGNKILVEYENKVTQKEEKRSCFKLVTLKGQGSQGQGSQGQGSQGQGSQGQGSQGQGSQGVSAQWTTRAKYGKKYFVQWDDDFEGRWYEADIYHYYVKGTYAFRTHDGSDGKEKPAFEIAKLGEQSEVNDKVLSYYKDKIFAMPGVHKETKINNGKVLIRVQYYDKSAGEEWKDASFVYKLVTLKELNENPLVKPDGIGCFIPDYVPNAPIINRDYRYAGSQWDCQKKCKSSRNYSGCYFFSYKPVKHHRDYRKRERGVCILYTENITGWSKEKGYFYGTKNCP